ncbi:MAG: two-component system response regulator [Chitinophagaceae bacterium]
MRTPFQFIIVDDDPTSNLVCEYTIASTYGAAETKTYVEPTAALEYLRKEFQPDAATTTTLLLDINMPGMDGWEFMQAFSRLDSDIKNAIRVYILSSSTNEDDIQKAASIPEVEGFLNKPFLHNSHASNSNRPYFRELVC